MILKASMGLLRTGVLFFRLMPNVYAMNSGGLRETMYQTTQSLRAGQVD